MYSFAAIVLQDKLLASISSGLCPEGVVLLLVMKRRAELLLGRVVGKLDTLGNVALETLDGLCQQGLFLLGDALQWVGGLFGTVGL